MPKCAPEKYQIFQKRCKCNLNANFAIYLTQLRFWMLSSVYCRFVFDAYRELKASLFVTFFPDPFMLLLVEFSLVIFCDPSRYPLNHFCRIPSKMDLGPFLGKYLLFHAPCSAARSSRILCRLSRPLRETKQTKDTRFEGQWSTITENNLTENRPAGSLTFCCDFFGVSKRSQKAARIHTAIMCTACMLKAFINFEEPFGQWFDCVEAWFCVQNMWLSLLNRLCWICNVK